MLTFSRTLICIMVLLLASRGVALAQGGNDAQLRDLNNRMYALESRSVQVDSGAGGLAAFVAATVCALWAQNTGRSPWLWFFMGLFFNLITLLVLLSKNARDRATRPPAKA